MENNETIQGDLYLVGDELDLNGKTLNITGNLIHGAGIVKVNGGKLNIGGDYIIRSYTLDENNSPVYHYSLGELIMTNANDEVNVTGNFVMGSAKDHQNLLTNGILRVGGDFDQITIQSAYNFAPTENHKVILNGHGEQIVKFASYDTSHFANVEFANTTANAIKITSGTVVTGEVAVTQKRPTGYIDLYSTATVKNNIIDANIRFMSGYSLKDNLTVDGNIEVNSNLNLNTHQLKADTVTVKNSIITLNNGELICNGNLSLYSDWWYNCYIEMVHPNAHVVVNGNFTSCNSNYTIMTDGTLEIKGNFIQQTNKSYQNEENFRAVKNHKMIFNGTQEQKISFSSPKSYFNEVEINNTSQQGVYVTDFFNHSQLNITVGTITFADGTTAGETLTADKTVNNLYLGSGVYDLKIVLTAEKTSIRQGILR